MNKNIFFILFLSFLLVCCKQTKETNKTSGDSINTLKDTLKKIISDSGNTNPSGKISSFISNGYLILDTASGDLNLDSIPDMILILKKNNENETSDVVEHPEKRPLLILTGQKNGTYRLEAKSDNAVYCIDCGGVMGDPYQSITIKDGYFSIEHYGGSNWRWTRVITFRYSTEDNKWYLHKDGGDSFNTGNPDKVETRIRTIKDFGKVLFEKFDIYKEN